MVSFVVDEDDLRRLSPEARRELLQVLGSDLAAVKSEFVDSAWDPDGNVSYPLNHEEARSLVRGLPEECKRLLRVFCREFDGEAGQGRLEDLLVASGHDSYDTLGTDISDITQRLRGVTGNADAWLFNWRAKDWEWDEARDTYVRGYYFISGPAIQSLRAAFSITSTPR